VPAGSRRLAQDLVGPLGRSTGEPIDVADAHRKMFLAGAVALRSCFRCNCGVPCEEHAEEAMIARLGMAELDKLLEARDAAKGREHAALIDVFWQLAERQNGQKPVMGPADGPAFARLLKALGFEKAKHVIERAFEVEQDPQWRTIVHIAKNPNRYLLAQPRGRSRGASTLQSEPEALP